MKRCPEPAYPKDGFDFKPPPPGNCVGYPLRINLSLDENKRTCRKYARKAITAFNNKYKGRKKMLKLVKVVLATHEAGCGSNYFLTFVASKSHKKSKDNKTYKALVTGPSWNYEVIALRREAAEGSGSCNVKWYWDTRADPKPPSESWGS